MTKSEQLDPTREIAYGAVSGICGKIIEHPFDTIKVRLQSSSTSISNLQSIRQIYKNEGIFNGFYNGIRAPMIGACFENAILFSAYNAATSYVAKNFYGKDQEDALPLWCKCASGGFSGFMAAFVLTPVELVKCNLQVMNLTNAETVKSSSSPYLTLIRSIIRRNGLSGLWKGLPSTLIREVGGTAIWFGSYEYMSDYFHRKGLTSDLYLLLSGALAGVAFNFSMFPIDTIKSNIQTEGVIGNKFKDSDKGKGKSWQVFKQLITRKGGILNLYNGLSITIIRAVPANAVIFYVYQSLKRDF